MYFRSIPKYYTMKQLNIISWFLGISLFMTGILKFIDPFKTWYAAQISGSGMGALEHILGLTGEIGVGLAVMLTLIFRSKMQINTFSRLIILLSAGVIVIMVVASYVHMQPNVPAEVLPMQIKPPIIPGFYILLSVLNIVLVKKHVK